MKVKYQQSGFTLIELMVVVTVIAILVSIAIPVFSLARESAFRSACYANLRTLNGAIQTYRAQNGELPQVTKYSWSEGDNLSGTLVDSDINQDDLVPFYLKRAPYCPKGGIYTYSTDIDLTTEFCTCSYSAHNTR